VCDKQLNRFTLNIKWFERQPFITLTKGCMKRTSNVILKEYKALILELDQKEQVVRDWYAEEADRHREMAKINTETEVIRNRLSHIQKEYAESVIKESK
jgi:hypothetical protein